MTNYFQALIVKSINLKPSIVIFSTLVVFTVTHAEPPPFQTTDATNKDIAYKVMPPSDCVTAGSDGNAWKFKNRCTAPMIIVYCVDPGKPSNARDEARISNSSCSGGLLQRADVFGNSETHVRASSETGSILLKPTDVSGVSLVACAGTHPHRDYPAFWSDVYQIYRNGVTLTGSCLAPIEKTQWKNIKIVEWPLTQGELQSRHGVKSVKLRISE